MEKNRLQLELERRRAEAPSNLIDLSDTSFHANGLRFPDGELRRLIEDYLPRRDYRPDPKGDVEARRAVSAYYARCGVEVHPDHVFITASTSESYSLLFASLAEAGDNVVLPRPSYPLFDYLAGFARLEARYYDMSFERSYRIDFDSLAAQIDRRTRFVVLISPNNPTGRVATSEEVAILLRLCGHSGAMIVSDEVFSEFLYPDGPPSGTPSFPRPAAHASDLPVFTLNGVSKMFASPDLKLAWIAATGEGEGFAEALDRLETANDTFLNCSSLSQALLPGLFARGGEFTRTMIEELRARRSRLFAALALSEADLASEGPIAGKRGVRLVPPNGGIHCVIALPRGSGASWSDDEDFAVELVRKQGVYVHPGYFYSIDEREREISIVVSFLKKPELLAEGLSRLLDFL